MHRLRVAADLPLVVAGGVLWIALLSGPSAPADAQTVFQWTDEKGVIHFSNSAPPKGVTFQQRNMPVAPPIASLPATTDAPARDAGTGAKDPGQPFGAKLVLEGIEHTREGPSSVEFTGKVKNVGSSPARNAAVKITVMDPEQGDECLQEEIDVRPSTIGPGETAEYVGFFENPCLFGEPKVALEPVWTSVDR